MPSTQLNNYVGIEKSVIVWDNYELGHYMFPVRTREPADKRFVFEFTTSNVFYLNDPKENVETTLSKLQMSLESGHRHIEHLILFGDDPRLMPLLMRWFEPQPIFAEGRLRVLKHKSP
jgi:hypothetical protein